MVLEVKKPDQCIPINYVLVGPSSVTIICTLNHFIPVHEPFAANKGILYALNSKLKDFCCPPYIITLSNVKYHSYDGNVFLKVGSKHSKGL